MDDRDLEARLSAHLHRRLDDAQPPAELAASVAQGFATQPRRIGLPGLGVHSPMRIGFSLTAVAVAVAVLAVAASSLGFHLGPNVGNGPSPSPTAAPVERTFIVLPPTPQVPAKPEAIVAGDVLAARLRALGIGTFTMSGGYGMTFTFFDAPGGPGPTDDTVRAVLAAPGVVQFIPIPTGDPTVSAGQTLPHPYPVLFGNEGIASVREGTDQNGNAALNINLVPAATRLFADYTTNHIGDQLAIVIDGRVASAPIIQSAIAGGDVQVSNDSSTIGIALAAQLRAILIGGSLPEAWRGAPVPKIITREAAAALALAEPGATDLLYAQADAELVSGQWRAVWSIGVGGSFPDFPCTESPSPCPIAGVEVVKIDAVDGVVIGHEPGGPTP